MATDSTWECEECARRFDTLVGGTMGTEQLRCEQCDEAKWLPRTEVDPLPAFEPFEQPRTPQEALVLRARMLAILKAPRPKQEFSCEICGGKMLAGLKPMCPICKSRNVREVSVRCYLD